MWYGATPIPSDRNPAKVGPTESVDGMVTVHGTSGTQYRYFEERIYLGDPLMVLGVFSRARSGGDDDEEVDAEDSDSDVDDAEARGAYMKKGLSK